MPLRMAGRADDLAGCSPGYTCKGEIVREGKGVQGWSKGSSRAGQAYWLPLSERGGRRVVHGGGENTWRPVRRVLACTAAGKRELRTGELMPRRLEKGGSNRDKPGRVWRERKTVICKNSGRMVHLGGWRGEDVFRAQGRAWK